MSPLSLYVHIPFCVRRCSYCSFYHVPPTEDTEAAFVDVLKEEIRSRLGRQGDPVALRTVYFGGGSPSVLRERSWAQVFDSLQPYISNVDTVEITCELNPEDVTDGLLEFLRARGVNRVSLGVQSMDPAAQKRLERCTPSENARAIEAVTGRFANVSFDVLLGIPDGGRGQRRALRPIGRLRPRRGLERTIATLARSRPAHFSVYCLEQGGDLGGDARFFEGVDPDRSAEEYLYVCDYLAALGYRHYEVSNFALPGQESKHNRCYWEGGDYIGLGPGAHSYVDGRRFHNIPSLRVYLAHAAASPERVRVVDHRDGASVETERLMLALRTAEGAPVEWLDCEGDGFDDILKNGLARIEGRKAPRFKLSDRGFLVLNDILLRLRTAEGGRVAADAEHD